MSEYIRHWFWHILAMLTQCDLYHAEVSDEEYARYCAFMRRHGFLGAP